MDGAVSYLLKTYVNGRIHGTGSYDDQFMAVESANGALATGICDEWEVSTDIEGRTWVVSYGMDYDAAERNMKAEEIVK